MIFRDYLNAVADVMHAKFEGNRWQGQNPADIGEVCETLIKEFLSQFLSSQFAIFRGGHIVSIAGGKSKQMDVVLCSRNYPSIFAEKGIYPVESVLGAFSVTSNLGREKLRETVSCLASIPNEDPRFFYIAPWSGAVEPNLQVIEAWKRRVPYRCVFAINGVLDDESVRGLNKQVDSGQFPQERLPNLIVVNRQGMIVRNHFELRVNGSPVNGHFYYSDLRGQQTGWQPLGHIINELTQIYALWGSSALPKYNEYFDRDAQI